MAEIVRMPKMSDTMTEGVVAKWHKKVGDKIKSGSVRALMRAVTVWRLNNVRPQLGQAT